MNPGTVHGENRFSLCQQLPVADSFLEDNEILFVFAMTIFWALETAQWVKHLLCESDSLPRKGEGRGKSEGRALPCRGSPTHTRYCKQNQKYITGFHGPVTAFILKCPVFCPGERRDGKWKETLELVANLHLFPSQFPSVLNSHGPFALSGLDGPSTPGPFSPDLQKT